MELLREIYSEFIASLLTRRRGEESKARNKPRMKQIFLTEFRNNQAETWNT